LNKLYYIKKLKGEVIRMILRLCLKDKSSILIEGSMVDINEQSKQGQFIKVINLKTQKPEMYNKDFIWVIRVSSQNDLEHSKIEFKEDK
jgi:hypothetical protein